MTERQGDTGLHRASDRDRASDRERSTETKASTKTTELIVYALAVLGVLIASFLVQEASFGADHAWRYVTYLTIGYMISRGLAKAGSRYPQDD